jgi:hypothetical protein
VDSPEHTIIANAPDEPTLPQPRKSFDRMNKEMHFPLPSPADPRTESKAAVAPLNMHVGGFYIAPLNADIEELFVKNK